MRSSTPQGGSKLAQEEEQKQASEIVIDGPNIAMAHSVNKWPASARGIEYAIRHYQKLGWKVRAIVPRHFLGKKSRRGVDDPGLMEKLQDEGVVFTVPSQDHDDNYWIAYAFQSGAYVVTNDRMKDHAEKHAEGEDVFFQWRQQRVISYAFIDDTFLPNPDFKLPKPPKLPAEAMKAKPEQKQTEVKQKVARHEKKSQAKKPQAKTPPRKKSPQQQSQAKTAPAKTPRQKKSRRGAGSRSAQGGKPAQGDLEQSVKSAIRSRLSSGPLHLQTLSQHLLKVIRKKGGQNYTSIKAMMGDMKISRSRPFYYQLEKLIGDEVEIVHKASLPHSAKLKTGARPEQQRHTVGEHRKSSGKSPKRMTIPFFKQALGERNATALSGSIEGFPVPIEKAFTMLCDLDFPINVAAVGNRFKSKTGFRLSKLFNKMDKLAFFLTIRPECGCGEVYAEDMYFHCRAAPESPSDGGKDGVLKSATRPLSKMWNKLKGFFAR